MQLLSVEFGLSILAILLAFVAPRLGDRWFSAIEHRLGRFSVKRRTAVFTIFFLALGLRLAVLPIKPIPSPGVHDEFSYLLMADTFAHGRLTNPTHPMWEHFETFHVNQKPTYCSMYYPGQGLFLALGQVVFGHPFWGVWLSTGLMCAVICWALQGWMPPGWAFLGGFLAMLRIGVLSYWNDSYWGGSVAALGGALVLGALPRIKHRQRIRDAIAMGVGLSILGNTRPYESIFYAAPILAFLAIFVFRRQADLARSFKRVVLPLSIVLLITLSAMGYYFWRCTGSPLTTPYMVNVRAYQLAPIFPWQKINSVPAYRHLAMRNFYYGFELFKYTHYRSHPARTIAVRLVYTWIFFIGPLLFLPWLTAIGTLFPRTSLRNLGKTGVLVIICASSVLGSLLPSYFMTHYAAPACCVLYAVTMQAMRGTRLWQRKAGRRGLFLVRAVVIFSIAVFLLRVFAAHTPLAAPIPDVEPGVQIQVRQRALADLNQMTGKQLVIVHYAPDHGSSNELVYNGADIDAQKIVWARDMGADKNQELIDYFKDRRAWWLDADQGPRTVRPYSSSGGLARSTGAAPLLLACARAQARSCYLAAPGLSCRCPHNQH